MHRTFFREEVAEPLGLDFWIGLPEALESRVAPIIPADPPDPSGHLNSMFQAIFTLELRNGEVGLDLGTGTADLSIAVIRRSEPGARMIGIDITPEMLERGSIKVARLGLQDRIELRLGDAKHIDVPDNTVDGCCSAFTVRNLTDIRKCCAWYDRVDASSAWKSVIHQAMFSAHSSISTFTRSLPYLEPSSATPLKNTTTCHILSPGT